MKRIIKYILEQILGNKAWAGLAVLVAIFTLFFSFKESSIINQRISLIELDKNISEKYKIKNTKSNYIMNNDDIDIVKNQFNNNSFVFSIRNNTDHEILINKAKFNLYTTYRNCYQPTPIKYKVNFTLEKSQYEIDGTILSFSELEFEWDEIIRSKEIEIYKLLIDDLDFDKKSCINYFMFNIDFAYDNKYVISTPTLRIKYNEIN